MLKEINSKNFARQREEARREGLRKAFGTTGQKDEGEEGRGRAVEEAVAAEDLGLDASKLAERRKQLFSSRYVGSIVSPF